MIKVILLLFPRWWRERYGNEAASLVVTKEDAMDLVRAALRTRLEAEMNTLVIGVVYVAAALCLWLFGYTTGQLAGGPAETFEHWWSSLAVFGVALSGSLVWFTVWRAGRTTKPESPSI